MDLLQVNQNYAIIRSSEGREVTVSAKDIAPTLAGLGEPNESQSFSQSNAIKFHLIGAPVAKDDRTIDYSTISLTVLLSAYFLNPA